MEMKLPAVVTEVKVLSYNVWGHYFVGGKNLAGRLEVLAANIARERYDVVAVQELFHLQLGFVSVTKDFDMLADRLRGLGLVHTTDISVSAQPVFGQNSGLAVFSRFPFLAVSEETFSFSTESVNRKGFLCVDIEVPGCEVPLRIINCHLDSRSERAKRIQIAQISTRLYALTSSATHPTGVRLPPSSSSSSSSSRARQQQQNHVAAAVPLIITGDFNVCQQPCYEDAGELYQALSRAFGCFGLDDLFRHMDTITHREDHCALDHMFVSKDSLWVRASRVVDFTSADGEHVSDHNGIEACFSLVPPGGGGGVGGSRRASRVLSTAAAAAAATAPAEDTSGHEREKEQEQRTLADDEAVVPSHMLAAAVTPDQCFDSDGGAVARATDASSVHSSSLALVLEADERDKRAEGGEGGEAEA
jgi:endonuclease/exonuclease/phosphatase family metal-dependent hydrolase